MRAASEHVDDDVEALPRSKRICNSELNLGDEKFEVAPARCHSQHVEEHGLPLRFAGVILFAGAKPHQNLFAVRQATWTWTWSSGAIPEMPLPPSSHHHILLSHLHRHLPRHHLRHHCYPHQYQRCLGQARRRFRHRTRLRLLPRPLAQMPACPNFERAASRGMVTTSPGPRVCGCMRARVTI